MKTALVTLIAVSIAALVGCGGAQQASAPESRNIPTFDYNPPSTAPADSASVVFAVVNPQFPDDWAAYRMEAPYPFDKFSKNMSGDFEEILSARGFRIRGVFRNFDEMTFPDKDNSDLILMPDIQIEVMPVGQATSGTDLFGNTKHGWKGSINLGGRITISLNESLTNERMWTKSIELAPRSFEWEVRSLTSPISRPSFSDEKLYNKMAEHLQSYYNDAMGKIWTYLDPEEMKMVREQAQPLKDKKRF